MKVLEHEIRAIASKHGANFVCFVDISPLAPEQNKHFPNAILIGIALSRNYLLEISRTPDYVKTLVEANRMQEDEFHNKEILADQIADTLAAYLKEQGYSAYSQSEANIIATGFYNEKTKTTPLPHKTIAGLAGLGWIGKHNLLVTPEYGSALCMCTVLTDAPLPAHSQKPISPQCGTCQLCRQICPVRAIQGKLWSEATTRDDLVDVYECKTCLLCLVLCPWTQQYMNHERT